MRHGGTKYHITALMAAVFGLLCLPCLIAPLLISAGLSSVLLLIGTWFVPVLLALIAVGIIGFSSPTAATKTRCPLCSR